MTTNNPPIAAWAPSTALHKLASRHNNAPCILTDGPAEFNDAALVRLADYKALQAAHEEELFRVRQDRDTHFGEMMRAIGQVDALQAECEELRHALFESRANDRQAMAYLNQVRELVGGDDFPDMVRRCEKLRKDAKRYVPLNEAVQRAAAELPEAWEIHLCVVRYSGSVDLIGPDGTEDFYTDNERLDYTVIDALEFAIDAAMQGDQP